MGGPALKASDGAFGFQSHFEAVHELRDGARFEVFGFASEGDFRGRRTDPDQPQIDNML
jgi:hypothetical protein